MAAEIVRTIIQLAEDQAAALERAARRRGVSKAALVREALAMLLAGASGVHDLAERHDDYLADQA